MASTPTFLNRYDTDGGKVLKKIVTGGETWVLLDTRETNSTIKTMNAFKLTKVNKNMTRINPTEPFKTKEQ